ncbi:prepilin peptidase [Carnobacterium divergens]|uniref:A24 family peptidase n=1 Tax=Carnobacterium divergens TaxID=2748 RepID=UPI0039B0D6A5
MTLSTIIILMLFIVIAFYYDIKFHIIPNKLILIFLPLGLINSIIVNQMEGIISSGLGFLVSGGIMMILYVFKALAAGDVKLFATIGVIAGIGFSLYCMMYTIVIGGILAIVILLFTRTFLSQMLSAVQHIGMSFIFKNTNPLHTFKSTKATTMPFMVAVLPGALITLYYMYLA